MAKKKSQSFHLKNKRSLLVLGCIILTVLIVYLAGVLYYQDKFLNHTYINGHDVGNMTQSEANHVMETNIGKQSLTLVFRDGQSEILQSSQLGVSFNKDNSIKKVMDQQNKWSWFLNFFTDEKKAVDDIVHVDDEGLNQGILSLQHAQQEQQLAPTDAYIKYENGQFSIVKETYGSQLNMDQLIKEIKVALSGGKNKMNIEKINGYTTPNVKEDDQDLKNKCEAANQYCLASISYQSSKGKVLTLDGQTMIDWLTKKEDGSYIKDDAVFKEKISDFVSQVATQFNTKGETRTFTGGDGVSHTVSGGTYGVRVSQNEEIEALLSLVNEKKTVTERVPCVTGKVTEENGGLGNTFIEVNITKQHLWYHKNGSVVMETDIVSGTETKSDRYTPSGTYYIYAKQRNRILRGQKQPDGTYEYETPVSYWMPFNKGIGLHDASWRKTFGGQIYMTSGSHGCVNLPSSFAANLYSQVTVNTPVVVYR